MGHLHGHRSERKGFFYPELVKHVIQARLLNRTCFEKVISYSPKVRFLMEAKSIDHHSKSTDIFVRLSHNVDHFRASIEELEKKTDKFNDFSMNHYCFMHKYFVVNYVSSDHGLKFGRGLKNENLSSR